VRGLLVSILVTCLVLRLPVDLIGRVVFLLLLLRQQQLLLILPQLPLDHASCMRVLTY
jgi:hypothetical protein